jgi:hypothetical protein
MQHTLIPIGEAPELPLAGCDVKGRKSVLVAVQGPKQ